MSVLHLVLTRECSPDNDDDGETAAGGRLAHLLQILVRVEFHIVMARC